MSTPHNGGAAFPTQHPALDPRASGFNTEAGMSLRDYFAAAALQGCLADCLSYGKPTDYALRAYEFADAMLKARKECAK